MFGGTASTIQTTKHRTSVTNRTNVVCMSKCDHETQGIPPQHPNAAIIFSRLLQTYHQGHRLWSNKPILGKSGPWITSTRTYQNNKGVKFRREVVTRGERQVLIHISSSFPLMFKVTSHGGISQCRRGTSLQRSIMSMFLPTNTSEMAYGFPTDQLE